MGPIPLERTDKNGIVATAKRARDYPDTENSTTQKRHHSPSSSDPNKKTLTIPLVDPSDATQKFKKTRTLK